MTYEQYFKEKLPFGIASKAIDNMMNEGLNPYEELEDLSLSDAFVWKETREGYDYWSNIQKTYNV